DRFNTPRAAVAGGDVDEAATEASSAVTGAQIEIGEYPFEPTKLHVKVERQDRVADRASLVADDPGAPEGGHGDELAERCGRAREKADALKAVVRPDKATKIMETPPTGQGDPGGSATTPPRQPISYSRRRIGSHAACGLCGR